MKKLPSNIKAILFDLDGTLVDSMWIWLEVDRIFLGKHGLVAPDGFYEKIEGMSYTETAQCFLETFPALGMDLEEIKREWLDMTKEMYATKVPLKKGAARLLAWCKEYHIPTGIATSNTRELVELLLAALHIKDQFAVVMTACEAGRGKPAPDVYLAAAAAIGVSPGDCLVFEDVSPGVEAGRCAGMTVWAVDDPFCLDPEKKRALAHETIRDFTEIML